jgi:hypothetical protein
LKNGNTLEERQPHIRGGTHEPLSRADVEEKFRLNCAYGGWPAERSEDLLAWAKTAFERPIDLKPFRT